MGIYVASLILMVAIFSGLLFDQYHQEVRNAHEHNATRASLIAEWVHTTFALSDHVLKDVVLLLASPLKISLRDGLLLEDLLMAKADSMALISEISVINRHGSVLASTGSVHPPGYDMRRMPFFHHLKEGPGASYVSPLFWSAFDRDYRIIHAQALHDDADSFSGFIVVQLAPRCFHNPCSILIYSQEKVLRSWILKDAC
ncbi:hypothetical protein HLB35_12810 [Halomonas sp. TBZ9]|uniref:Uncharacterized protein n=1 Tax=Vreelandella azerica TaxID=2732867 RepID=A0A7Y3XBN2_9GAMM|nr:hypothetical protein [Halomonas azerica]NOG32415.1 hypothetical protein [Halomonas azerica]